MSQKMLVAMPGVDLGSDQAFEQIQKIKDRLDILTWYLQAQALNDFFNQFPDLKSVRIDNIGTGETPRLCFSEEEWVEGYRYDLPEEDRKALGLAIAALDNRFSELVNETTVPSLRELERQRYVDAGEVFDSFGRHWRNGRDNSLAQWTALLAEVGQADLEGRVDPVLPVDVKTPNGRALTPPRY